MSQPETPAVQLARNVLRGKEIGTDDMIDLAEALMAERAFGLARQLFGRVAESNEIRTSSRRRHVSQRHALTTYRDPDLPVDIRLERAFEILAEGDDIETTTDQESLGLAGAIYKRKWEAHNQRQHLERSLSYYVRGYRVGVEKDHGYTAVNAAFVLDLLAHQERREAARAGGESTTAALRSEEAAAIRRQIVSVLEALAAEPENSNLLDRWWFVVTLGEALFGLREYERAIPYFERAARMEGIAEWKRESTARQLAALARLHGDDGNAVTASEALKVFLGNDYAALASAEDEKIGLALSGGGFRASLFHIGVLAKLAERDLLRRVEVLSCVSGGSIIGAHYYLEVRRLLHQKRDREISRQDYIDIVRRIETDFLAGVQMNIRMHVLAEWTTNLRMIFRRNYSRTMRAGELYEELIYAKIEDGENDETRFLSGLKIEPAGEDGGFSPRLQNWRRRAKVPILVINATTLNTGHNWQFTATWMGEPPGAIDARIDGNDRLRRMYYEDAPEAYRKVRLGHAVAASACVPGLFEPLAMEGLYPGQTVRLVDGGVHDNQGVTGLLEQGCRVIIVSDASGQIDALEHPGNGALGVLLRSTEIFQARMREAAFNDLASRERSMLLKGLVFVHLKKDLDVEAVNWVDCPDPHDAFDDIRPVSRRGPLTPYGINKDLQRAIAGLRTDLDSFSDTEAFALMTSGYRMADHELPRCLPDLMADGDEREAWSFLAVEPQLSRVPPENSFARHIKVGSDRFFKAWRLSPELRLAAIGLGVFAIGLLVLTWAAWWPFTVLTVTLGGIATMAVLAAAGRIFGSSTMRVVRYRKTLRDVLIGTGMAIGGFLLARLHLLIIDPWFLRLGRIRTEPRRVARAAPSTRDPARAEHAASVSRSAAAARHDA